MKKLIMLSSHEGSRDGIHVQWYLVGRTYDVTESLAAIFLKEGWAKDTDAADPLPVLEAPKAEIAPAHKQEYSAKKGRNR
jgi:hypothetical protein